MARAIVLTLGLVCFAILTVNLLMAEDRYIDPKYAKSREFKVGDMVFFRDDAVLTRGEETLDPHVSIPWPCRIEKIEGDQLWMSRGFIPKDDVMSAQEALDYADEEVKRNPTSWLGWRARGVSWVALGEAGKGLKDYDQAILLEPAGAVAFADRAHIKELLGDLNGAIKDFDKAILYSDRGTRPRLYINRALIKVSACQYADAIKDFDKAIELDAKYPEVYYDRGLAKSLMGNRAAAMKDYDQAIQLNPDYKHAYQSRGRLKRRYKDFEEAIEDFNECIRLEPNDVSTLVERGWVYHRLGHYEHAIKDYSKAIEVDERCCEAKSLLSFLLASCPDEKLRDVVTSLQWSENVLRANPNYAYAVSAKACGMAQIGKFDEAIELEKKALTSKGFANDKDFEGGSRSAGRIAAWKEKKQWYAIPGEAAPKSKETMIATQARESASQAKSKTAAPKPTAQPPKQKPQQKQIPRAADDFMRA